MISNYRSLTEQINNRLNPDRLDYFEKSIVNELRSVSYSDVLKFVKIAMQGVPEEYTRQSIEAGENVKNHLRKKLTDVSYQFQGSVMTNTHTKGYSDIDLLVVSEKFYIWDAPGVTKYLTEQHLRSALNNESIQRLEREQNLPNYTGDSLMDLRSIRMTSEDVLSQTYDTCDTSRPKSIKITNTNLRRDVDIVTANWYDDIRSIIYSKGQQRGVQVYNKDLHMKEKVDFPFISIQRINDRGTETNGRLKKMIRFLKNVKNASSQDIDLSSFDINAICYNILVSQYQNADYKQLVTVIYTQLYNICNSQEYADNIVSVDDREYIFRNNAHKLNNLRRLFNDVEQVYQDLQKELL